MQTILSQFDVSAERASLLRRIISVLLPGIENNEIFSTASVTALLGRIGKEKTRTAKIDSELTRSYCCLLRRQGTLVCFMGRGISDRGCPITYRILWNDQEQNNSVVAIDPHGLYSNQEAALSFQTRESRGPVTWVDRKVVREHATPISSSVRGLKQEDVEILKTEVLEEIQHLKSGSRQPLLQDFDTIRALSQITELADRQKSDFCAIVRRDDKILTAWPCLGGGFGYLTTSSPNSQLTDEPLVCTFEGLRVLRLVLDKLKDGTCIALLYTPSTQCWTVTIRFSFAVVELCWGRETMVVSQDSPDRAIARTKFLVNASERVTPVEWGAQHSLTTFSDGLDLASRLAVPVIGQENSAGVRFEIQEKAEQPGYNIRSRNGIQSVIFRLGNLDGAVQQSSVFLASTLLSSTVAKTLKALAQNLKLKSMPVKVVPVKRSNLLMFRDDTSGQHVTIGFLLPDNPAVNLLFVEASIQPNRTSKSLVLNAKSTLEMTHLLFELSGLATFSQFKKEMLQPSLLAIKSQSLILELGGIGHVIGGQVPINRQAGTDNPWFGVKVPEVTFQNSLKLLNDVRLLTEKTQQREDRTEILVQMQSDHDRPALFLTLFDRQTIIAKISSREAQGITVEEEDLPLYRSLSPIWTQTSVEFRDLPPASLMEALAGIHSAYQIAREDLDTSEVKIALSNALYKHDGHMLIAGLHQAIDWYVEPSIFGPTSELYPSGFFNVASKLYRKRSDTRYAMTQFQSYLRAKDVYALWRRPAPTIRGSGYPKSIVDRILQEGGGSNRPTYNGIVHGMGTFGEVKATISPEDFQERIHESQSDGSFSRFFWLWDHQGNHQVIPDYLLGKDISFPIPLSAELASFTCENGIFYMCLQRGYLGKLLHEIRAAETLLGTCYPLQVKLTPTGVYMKTYNFESVVLPSQISAQEVELLNSITNLTCEAP